MGESIKISKLLLLGCSEEERTLEIKLHGSPFNHNPESLLACEIQHREEVILQSRNMQYSVKHNISPRDTIEQWGELNGTNSC